jgi:hypothetical protein
METDIQTARHDNGVTGVYEVPGEQRYHESSAQGMERRKLSAVHDDDLEALLRGLGVHNDFINGKLKCAFCRVVIGWSNLQSLFPDSGDVKCCCDRPGCVAQLVARMEELRQRDRRRNNR